MSKKCYLEVETKGRSSYSGDNVMLMSKKAFKEEKESMKRGFSPYMSIKVLRRNICDVKKWKESY